jgi:hypothetical protein
MVARAVSTTDRSCLSHTPASKEVGGAGYFARARVCPNAKHKSPSASHAEAPEAGGGGLCASQTNKLYQLSSPTHHHKKLQRARPTAAARPAATGEETATATAAERGDTAGGDVAAPKGRMSGAAQTSNAAAAAAAATSPPPQNEGGVGGVSGPPSHKSAAAGDDVRAVQQHTSGRLVGWSDGGAVQVERSWDP